MHQLSATDLLTVWERGVNQPSWRQALLLLAMAFPELDWETLLYTPIGQRDSLLLAVREQTFGHEMLAVVDCPNCQNTLDLNFLTRDIKAKPIPQDAMEFSTQVDEFEVTFRLPNSLDMAAVSSNRGQANILADCVQRIQMAGDEIVLADLPETAVSDLIQKMSEVDPQAEVLLDVVCPDCDHEWSALFDIFSFLWREIQSWAIGILQEVHLLASTYGWCESDILQMNAGRRKYYLSMIQG